MLKIYVYRAQVCDQEYVYRSRTHYAGDLSPALPLTYSSVSDLAIKVRHGVWDIRNRRPNEDMAIAFTPPYDIEWQGRDASPLRCASLDENDQEIFWQIFSRSKEDAASLKEALASAR